MTQTATYRSAASNLCSEALYWREIKGTEPLNRAAEAEMFRRIRAGDEQAREDLVRANLRFVVSTARAYKDRGVPLADLIAEGNMGLMEAVDRFDESRGLKFITYGVWWIRRAILAAIANNRRVARPPANQINDLQAIRRQWDGLTQQLGREPDTGELADRCGFSAARVTIAVLAGQRDTSLDAPAYSQGDTDMGSSFAEDGPGIDEQIADTQMQNAMHDFLDDLEEREHHVVCAYYGLLTAPPTTLAEIGDELGLTRERVRQIRNHALDTLRARHGDLLAQFCNN